MISAHHVLGKSETKELVLFNMAHVFREFLQPEEIFFIIIIYIISLCGVPERCEGMWLARLGNRFHSAPGF